MALTISSFEVSLTSKSKVRDAEEKNFVHRYTSFASAIHILSSKQLTLLSPSRWDDQNDVFYMGRYAEAVKPKQVYALCLSKSVQTYHHWHVFTQATDGACITFKENGLKAALDAFKEIEYREVEYASLSAARARRPLTTHDMKFLKNVRYAPEEEVRIIYTGEPANGYPPAIPVSLDIIDRITLSPWLNKNLFNTLKPLLKKIDGCSKLNIYLSEIRQSTRWQQLLDSQK